MLLTALLVVVGGLPGGLPDVDCSEGEEGRAFSTCFDPWFGLELGAGGGASNGRATPDVLVGLRFRGRRDSHSKTGSTWLIAHRAASTTVFMTAGPAGAAQPAVTATAWEGVFRRHVAEGAITLPTNPPTQLPFPLDVGLVVQVGRYERRVAEGRGWSLEAARVGLTLDPLRSASGRFHLALGPALSYRVRSDGATLSHEVMPLTGGLLFVNVESDDGLWVLRGEAQAGASFSLPSTTPTLRGHGELEASRVLFAVNDAPVALYVRGSGAWNDAGAFAQTEWAASAGLVVRLFSAR